MMTQITAVYIMANRKNGTIYVGVTSNLLDRVNTHRQGLIDGFTKKYNCKYLVYYEVFDSITQAIAREKQLKEFKRLWKIRLIEKNNPDWRDLYPDFA